MGRYSKETSHLLQGLLSLLLSEPGELKPVQLHLGTRALKEN